MLSQAFEEGENRLDMHYRIEIDHNDAIDVTISHCLKASRYLAKLTILPGEALLPRGMSHSRGPVGVQNAVGGTVSLCDVIWQNEETRSSRENTGPEPKETRT